MAAGAVHATLGRLEQKGLLTSRLGSGHADSRRPRAALLPAAARRTACAQRRARGHRQPVAGPSMAAERTRMTTNDAAVMDSLDRRAGRRVAPLLLPSGRSGNGRGRSDRGVPRHRVSSVRTNGGRTSGSCGRSPGSRGARRVVWGLAGRGVHRGPIRRSTRSPRLRATPRGPSSRPGHRSCCTCWRARWGARRTGRARTGMLLAVGAHAIGWTVSAAITVAHLRRRDPQPAGDAEPVSGDGRLGRAMVSSADAAAVRPGAGCDRRRVRADRSADAARA